jgi:hypothetical protein
MNYKQRKNFGIFVSGIRRSSGQLSENEPISLGLYLYTNTEARGEGLSSGNPGLNPACSIPSAAGFERRKLAYLTSCRG